MCAPEMSPELYRTHRLPQTFQVALAVNQESCSKPTAYRPLKNPVQMQTLRPLYREKQEPHLGMELVIVETRLGAGVPEEETSLC